MRFLKWLGLLVGGFALLIAVFIVSVTAWSAVADSTRLASWKGTRDAKADLSRGIYKELVFGLPVPWFWNYQKTMKTTYDIDVVAQGCIVTPRGGAYASAYDKVATEGIVRHFGRDVFKETSDQAEAEWDKTHPKSAEQTTE